MTNSSEEDHSRLRTMGVYSVREGIGRTETDLCMETPRFLGFTEVEKIPFLDLLDLDGRCKNPSQSKSMSLVLNGENRLLLLLL